MKYKYKPYANTTAANGELLTFPIVSVILKSGRTEISIECLVDSGASESLFSLDIARLLGVDLTKTQPQSYIGIGNISVPGYKSPVKLKLAGFDTWIAFDAGFIDQNEMPLLGHSGFFDNYEIIFRAYQNRFEIKSKIPKSYRPKKLHN